MGKYWVHVNHEINITDIKLCHRYNISFFIHEIFYEYFLQIIQVTPSIGITSSGLSTFVCIYLVLDLVHSDYKEIYFHCVWFSSLNQQHYRRGSTRFLLAWL